MVDAAGRMNKIVYEDQSELSKLLGDHATIMALQSGNIFACFNKIRQLLTSLFRLDLLENSAALGESLRTC